MPPRAVDGVPTHTSDTSARSSASAQDVVACSVPPATVWATSSSKPRLGDRATAGTDLIDLGGVDVHSPDVVAMGGQAGGRHRPDIAEADHCDLHRLTSPGLLCTGDPQRVSIRAPGG